MQGLDLEEVEHVADLANLVLTDKEKEKFSKQLQDILSDIDKINSIDIEESKILIAPTENHDLYHEDETEEGLKIEEVLKNANQTSGDYIVVSKEFHD